MPETTLTVRHKVGLHARPAALFVQTAKKFNSDIRVSHDEREEVVDHIRNALSQAAAHANELDEEIDREDMQ